MTVPEGSLDAADPWRGDIELAELVLHGVRRVVRRDCVDDSIVDAAQQRQAVSFRAERRIDLRVGVVERPRARPEHRVFREEQMAGSDFTGDVQSASLCVGDQLDAPRRRYVCKVEARSGGLGQGDVSRYRRDLGGGGLPRQAEAFAHAALVHGAAGVQHGVVAVLRDG